MTKLADRVKVGVDSGTSGTGTVTLGSAVSGFQAFHSSLNGDTVHDELVAGVFVQLYAFYAASGLQCAVQRERHGDLRA